MLGIAHKEVTLAVDCVLPGADGDGGGGKMAVGTFFSIEAGCGTS